MPSLSLTLSLSLTWQTHTHSRTWVNILTIIKQKRIGKVFFRNDFSCHASTTFSSHFLSCCSCSKPNNSCKSLIKNLWKYFWKINFLKFPLQVNIKIIYVTSLTNPPLNFHSNLPNDENCLLSKEIFSLRSWVEDFFTQSNAINLSVFTSHSHLSRKVEHVNAGERLVALLLISSPKLMS